MVVADVDGSIVDEPVDAVRDDVLVHVREGSVSIELVDVPVIDALAGVAHETADGFADAVAETEHAFPVVHEFGDRRVDFFEI